LHENGPIEYLHTFIDLDSDVVGYYPKLSLYAPPSLILLESQKYYCATLFSIQLYISFYSNK